jgi:acetoin utilization deacetylase AcuC-like enzyme
MGFCPVNHVAVAARHLQASGLAPRVVIVDWDVHHGNGTQDLFYEDGSVYYLSLHQYPFYPGTGPAEDRGAGAGLGTTLNVPLSEGTGSVEYLEAFEAALARIESEFAPDFVLVSAGYDTLSQDPLGGLLLEPADFSALTRLVCAWADRACGGRVVALLEGGYHPEQTAEAAVTTLLALSED